MTFLAVICITSLNGLIGIIGETIFCDLMPNLGTPGLQTEIFEAIFPGKEGIILRYHLYCTNVVAIIERWWFFLTGGVA